MNDEEAQKKAEKVQRLSLSIFRTAVSIAEIHTVVDILQEDLRSSALLLEEITKELPKEIQAKLRIVTPPEDDSKNDGLETYIRKLLEGGK